MANNVKTVKLKDLEVGSKFITPTGMKGFLIEIAVGSVTVLVHEVPKKRAFYKSDGTPDTYWTGKLRWGRDTEVIKQ